MNFYKLFLPAPKRDHNVFWPTGIRAKKGIVFPILKQCKIDEMQIWTLSLLILATLAKLQRLRAHPEDLHCVANFHLYFGF